MTLNSITKLKTSLLYGKAVTKSKKQICAVPILNADSVLHMEFSRRIINNLVNIFAPSLSKNDSDAKGKVYVNQH